MHDLRAEAKDDAWARQIGQDYTKAALDAPTRALLDYAWKLTKTPGAMAASDVQKLRDQGFSDRAVTDAAQVIGYFNYINRIADGLGVDPEPGLSH